MIVEQHLQAHRQRTAEQRTEGARMRPAKCTPFQCMGNNTRIGAICADSESFRSKVWKTTKDKVATVAPSSVSWRRLGRPGRRLARRPRFDVGNR